MVARSLAHRSGTATCRGTLATSAHLPISRIRVQVRTASTATPRRPDPRARWVGTAALNKLPSYTLHTSTASRRVGTAAPSKFGRRAGTSTLRIRAVWRE